MPGLWIDRLVPETVRIHQGSETMVVAALGRLRAEDERMAGDAEAALGSLTWDRGLQAITQHGLQAFLWHELPRKWLTDRRQAAHRRFAGAVLELVGLALWVPVIRFTSCDLRVLMDQPSEPISSHDPPSRHGDS
jgi:hypothetical protein